jgi:lipopolysaccharide transport system ATP-binding protein
MNTTSTAIKVENVGKLYRIGEKEQARDSLGEVIFDFLKSPISNYRKYKSLYKFDDVENLAGNADAENILWALEDVSFEVKMGEVVGIIGTNGAGKSTLLKILSRITPPTRGRVEIHGRVSSLLEVGTGFHNELTGRENVFLNGTVLGMRKKEIERKFDEIVEFSGVEKFLDTPVKRYSSGMRVRLAFAVAAHLEPEILIIDEVLAVGDAAFQRKCLNKMQEVGEQGRTVLFVSHNMPAVTRMCQRVILLNKGKVMVDGTAHEVVSAYLRRGETTTACREWENGIDAPAGEAARMIGVRVRNENGDISDAIDIRSPVSLELEFQVLKAGFVLQPHFGLFNEEGVRVFITVDQDEEWRGRPRPPGRYTSTVRVPGNFFSEGMIIINTALWALEPHRELVFKCKDAVAFHVIDNMEGGTARGDWVGDMGGIIRPLLEWETHYEAQQEVLLGG